MRWIRDGYATYHAVADRPLCTQSYDTMREETELPVGAFACSMCVRALVADYRPVQKVEALPVPERRPFQRGDQIERWDVAPSHLQKGELRWLLDEPVEHGCWMAYALEPGGTLGRRVKIDPTYAPTILKPWPRDIMQSEIEERRR